MLDHLSRLELACPTIDQVRLASGFGEALERLRVELDEPIHLNSAEGLCQSVFFVIEGPGFVDPESDKTIFSYAHPIFWATFALVVEGGGGK